MQIDDTQFAEVNSTSNDEL